LSVKLVKKLPWDEHSSLFGKPLWLTGGVLKETTKKHLVLAPQLGQLKKRFSLFCLDIGGEEKGFIRLTLGLVRN
jgi:hypothetical protein